MMVGADLRTVTVLEGNGTGRMLTPPAVSRVKVTVMSPATVPCWIAPFCDRVPVTETSVAALNWTPAVRGFVTTCVGGTVIVTVGGGGARLTVALPDLVASATPVAVTVTAWELVMLAGAVYSPVAEMLPTLGLIDQVTAVLVVPVTVAMNCWV